MVDISIVSYMTGQWPRQAVAHHSCFPGAGFCDARGVEQLEWSPRPVETIVTAAAGLAVCAAALATDALGRFLALIAGLGLLGIAVNDLVTRPRLRADPTGVVVRTLTSRIDLPWSQVEAIRVDQRRGVAVRSVLLEIDAGETIVMLSRHALGADPRDVADVLSDLRGATR